MFKKALGLMVGAGIVMGVSMAAAAAFTPGPTSDSTTVTFEAVVQPQIYAVADLNAGLLEYWQGSKRLEKGGNFGLNNWTNTPGGFKAAYSNIPFSVKVSGNNPANDGQPIFARAEIHNGQPTGRFDRLNSYYWVTARINQDIEGEKEVYGDNYRIEAGSLQSGGQTTTPTDDGAFFKRTGGWGATYNFANAPHDGEVRMSISAYANWVGGPQAGTPNNQVDDKWYQSADAGVYQAWITLEYTANLNTYNAELDAHNINR